MFYFIITPIQELFKRSFWTILGQLELFHQTMFDCKFHRNHFRKLLMSFSMLGKQIRVWNNTTLPNIKYNFIVCDLW